MKIELRLVDFQSRRKAKYNIMRIYNIYLCAVTLFPPPPLFDVDNLTILLFFDGWGIFDYSQFAESYAKITGLDDRHGKPRRQWEWREIPRVVPSPVARLNRYIGAYFVCHLASYDACALIPFKLFMGFRTLWALELAGAGYPLWLWAASPFACRWGPPAVTFWGGWRWVTCLLMCAKVAVGGGCRAILAKTSLSS